MKIYNLIHEQDTDAICGCDVRTFTDKSDAYFTMHREWLSAKEAWEYDAKRHGGDDECYCDKESAVIRDGDNVENWRIEECRLDARVAVRVKGGLVEEVYSNADVSVEVYDLDVSDFPDDGEQDEADRKEAELESLVKSPGWRAVW